MAFKRLETPIEDLFLIEPDVFSDSRGFFMETFNQREFEKVGLPLEFVQDNFSRSTKGIVRGLHFQIPPFQQGKLVFVPEGEVLDVALDLRKNSPTYGRHFSALLSGANKKMIYIPPGFAHGFSVISDYCLFFYKCTGFYKNEAEGGIQWNDPELNIDWMVSNPILSEKDKQNPPLKNFISPF